MTHARARAHTHTHTHTHVRPQTTAALCDLPVPSLHDGQTRTHTCAHRQQLPCVTYPCRLCTMARHTHTHAHAHTHTHVRPQTTAALCDLPVPSLHDGQTHIHTHTCTHRQALPCVTYPCRLCTMARHKHTHTHIRTHTHTRAPTDKRCPV